MAQTRTGGRRRAAITEAYVPTPQPQHARRFVGQSRYAAQPDVQQLRERAAVLAEAKALVDSFAEQNPEVLLPAAAPAPAPVPAAAHRVVALPVETFDEALRERAERGSLRRRFVSSLPHAAVAAVAVTGLAAAAVLPSGAEPAATVALDAQRVSAAPQPVRAAAVVAPASKASALPVVAVKAKAAPEDKVVEAVASGETAAEIATSGETSGMFSHPLPSGRKTSTFGNRPDPWGGSGTVGHIGTDFAAALGTPVRAAAAGTVVQAENTYGHSGIRVTIDHGNGLQTTYNHNSALKVTVGQKVKRGDVVSLVGSTGNSTGPHLHFEVIVDGKPVDAENWL